MMKKLYRLAIMSDIHSNYHALKACMDWIEKKNIDGILFAGDYISDCPYPQRTMELLRIAQKEYQTWFVKGNREEIMIDRYYDRIDWNIHQGSLRYTYDHLTSQDISFFETMPLSTRIEIDGYPVISMAHGDLHKSRNMIYPNNDLMQRLQKETDSQLHICGHTHRPFLYEQNDRIVMNPGSVGGAVSGYTKAEMAVVESQGEAWKPELLRIDYDVTALLQEFKESGLSKCAGVWGRCIVAILQSGTHYGEKCFSLINQYADETGKDFNDPELWERAADELGI